MTIMGKRDGDGRTVSRIRTVPPEAARGVRRLLFRGAKRRYGVVTGIFQILMPDLRVAYGTNMIYNRLHLAKWSALSRVQREMVATVVNGKIGGAP
jgi:hypothetical protein